MKPKSDETEQDQESQDDSEQSNDNGLATASLSDHSDEMEKQKQDTSGNKASQNDVVSKDDLLEIELFKATVDAEVAARNSTRFVNGGAIIVTITFLGALIGDDKLTKYVDLDPIKIALALWAFGLVSSVAGVFSGYLSQAFFYRVFRIERNFTAKGVYGPARFTMGLMYLFSFVSVAMFLAGVGLVLTSFKSP